MPYLIQKDRDGSTIQYWNLHEGALTIGRGDDVNGRVADAELSRKHFEVAKQDAAFRIKDLGSKNGTYVNNRPVTEQTLRPNDAIRAGGAQFIFMEGLTTIAVKISKDIEDLGKFKEPPTP